MRVFLYLLATLLGAGISLGLTRAEAAGPNAIRVSIDAPGTYEVPAAILAEAKLTEGAVVVEGFSGLIPCRIVAGALQFFADPGALRHDTIATFLVRATKDGDSQDDNVVASSEAFLTFERNSYHAPLPTRDGELLQAFTNETTPDWFYFGPPKSKQVISFELVAKPQGAGTLHLSLQGQRKKGSSSAVDLSINGNRLGGVRFATSAPLPCVLNVGADILHAGENTLVMRTRDGRVLLNRFAFYGFTFEPPTTVRKPLQIQAITIGKLAASGADYLVITVDAAKPALAKLLAHREKQGLKSKLVPIQDVFDDFSAGNFHPVALRRFIAHAYANWSPAPRYVLLVGEATYDVAWLAPRETLIPTALVDTYMNGASASDNWFVALGDKVAEPQLAIGRFPSAEPKQIASWVERTIAYEDSSKHGPWRRRLSFVAGQGRFGEAVDQAIEDVATRILSKTIPYAFDINMTYANPSSPYFLPASQLSPKVVSRLNEGAAILTYTGHGHKGGFDTLRYQGKRYSIFSSTDVAAVNAMGRPPVVNIIACWTGCFDDPEAEAVGEMLVESPSGPPAVFASTRISHPYSNALLGHDLVAGFFDGDLETRRLGDALAAAKRRLAGAQSATAERDTIVSYGAMFIKDPKLLTRLADENMHLYTLLGDPALRLALPAPDGIALACPNKAYCGSSVAVSATMPTSLNGAQAVITLELSRDHFKDEVEEFGPTDKPSDEDLNRNYAYANDKILAKAEVRVKNGSVQANLEIPEDLFPGTYYVKVIAWSETASLLGFKPIALDLPEDTEE